MRLQRTPAIYALRIRPGRIAEIESPLKRRNNKVVDFPVKCIVIAPWLLGAALMLVASQHDSDIASRQGTTLGQVVAHEPSNHNRYGYKFRVDGPEYTGWETPTKKEPTVGQSVTIYYDTRSPNENALTDYNELSSAWSARAWSVFFIAGLLLLVIYLTEHLRRRTSQ
jgi:Protein of unknown function (DUF3592)